MSSPTTYELAGGVATIRLDDGKANALSIRTIGELTACFERAEADDAIVVLTGRPGMLSAGFDLRCPPERVADMVAGGARLAERILGFPRPVVVACTGHAIAMGAFLLLSADYRVGTTGDFRIGLNEVAIGLTMPMFGLAIARHRLTAPYFDRCAATGALLGPEEARQAGFLDEVVEPEGVPEAGLAAARALAALDRDAHANTKLRVREQVIAGVRAGIERIERDSGVW